MTAVPEFQEILDEYFQSSRELLESAEALLLEMEADEGAPDPERLMDLKRTFHTLKGNSAMMGFGVIADVAHLMEDILAGVGHGDVVEEDLAAVLLSGMALVSEVVRSAAVPEETPAAWFGVLEQLKKAARNVEAGPAVPAASLPRPAAARLSDTDLAQRYLGTRSASLRVSQVKLDTLLELTGEIHILVTGLEARARARSAGDEELSLQVESLRKAFAFLEDQITSVRLVEIGTIFPRFRRLVRDLARAQGKEIELVTSGDGTALDKAIVDELAEPLLHLVRNAVDHGVESPEVREARGKPRTATVTLSARQSSDRVEISLVDDGGGIDVAAIRRKAEARGLSVVGLDERALLDLVFLPEFSTRDAVTELSGRGVGLDVVKTSVEGFGGSVFLQTLPGLGTEFRLHFPLTLAISHALLVAVDREVFAVPVNHVLEAVRLEPGSLSAVDRKPVLLWRGQLVPVVDAGRFLGTLGEDPPQRRTALVLGAGARRKALLVDQALDDQVIVVKRLDEVLGKPAGVSGATLLGSGRIVMILDAPYLLEAHLDELEAVTAGAGR